ncbi:MULTISPECIES: restriction endonuclease subunit S [Enterobacteriaceae]|uniref:restriction endonuclease subunit S n=1 Tax=Enterobacteriaceae TaxID=543 RepID=UPI0025AF6F8D|nr:MULTISPECIES: restriction endonuclease subunit S [Enterobacteriaceae]WJW95198.1 restriction endonuclease subunit S [Enterobacter pseudoroggenkampii]
MVPEGWKVAQLGELAKFSSGGTPSKQNLDLWGGDEPWISGKDLKSHYLNSSIDKLTLKGFSSAKKAPEGASLILVRGMTLLKDFPVGYATREVAFNQDLKALIPNENIDGLFLSFLLVAEKEKVLKLVSVAGHGTGRLDTTLIKSLIVQLPPHDEQKKIAKILFTWDKAIATTAQLLNNSQKQKKALMQQLLTGKKRFSEFKGDWKYVKLGSLLEYKQPTPYLVKSTDYNDDYETPVLTAGKTFVLGYTNESEGIYKDKLPVIIFDDFTTDSKFVDFPFKAKSSAMKILTASDGISIKYVFEAMQMLDFTIGGHQRHWISIFSNLVISIPEIDEQQKIASVLSTADSEIETLKQQLNRLEQEKKALLQQLLTGKRRVKMEVA